jgi:hypothetical protein
MFAGICFFPYSEASPVHDDADNSRKFKRVELPPQKQALTLHMYNICWAKSQINSKLSNFAAVVSNAWLLEQ